MSFHFCMQIYLQSEERASLLVDSSRQTVAEVGWLQAVGCLGGEEGRKQEAATESRQLADGRANSDYNTLRH